MKRELIQGCGFEEAALSRGDLTEVEWRILRVLLPVERDPANAGALAFKRSGDPNMGNFDDATILKSFGEVPKTWTNYDGLIPVPPHLWHLTILSPFLSVPFPSQFLHGFFFSSVLFGKVSSQSNRSIYRGPSGSALLFGHTLGIFAFHPTPDISLHHAN